MEKKNNKKIIIIVAVLVIIAVIVFAIINIRNNKNNSNDNGNTSTTKFNEIVNRSEHTYGNTDNHNASYGAIVTDKDYWYFAGTDGITKQSKEEILQFNTEKKIFSASSLYLNLYNDYLYFLNMENNTIYKIDKDGNSRQEIATKIKSFFIIDEYIYCNKYEGEYLGGIYRMDINGENEELIVDYSTRKFVIYGDWLYFIAGENVLTRTDLNGNYEEIIMGDVNNFKMLDNVILYEDVVDNNNVYMMSVDRTTQRISGTNYYDSQITVDSILFDENYICVLPTKTSTTITSYGRKYHPAFFQSRTTDNIYYTIFKIGENTRDYEMIGHILCAVSKSGSASYLNTEGSDFENIKELEE